MKLLRFAGIFFPALIAAQVAFAADPAPVSTPAPIPAAKKSLKNPVLLLHASVGTWRGKMNIMNAEKKVVRTLDVVQTYKWETGADGAKELIGDCVYSAPAKDGVLITVKIKSRTWSRKNEMFSELTQDGKVENFVVHRDENDFLIYQPVPENEVQKNEQPNKLTASQVRRDQASGKTVMEVRGFEKLQIKSPDGSVKNGVALLEATLEKDVPAKK